MAEVTIYTSPTCVHCKAAKAFMADNNIAYTEKDVAADTEARQWMLDRGYRGVPVIVIGIPVRYIHSHYGIASYSDFEAAVDLAVAVVEHMTQEKLESF